MESSARCAASAARIASLGRPKTKKQPSPWRSTRRPPHCSAGRWSASAWSPRSSANRCSPTSASRPVESSTSLNRKVRAPSINTSLGRRPRDPQGAGALACQEELRQAPDRVEAELPVELLRPVVPVRDEEHEIGALRARFLCRPKHDGARVALAAVHLLRGHILDLADALSDVEVAPAHDLAVGSDAEEARRRPFGQEPWHPSAVARLP